MSDFRKNMKIPLTGGEIAVVKEKLGEGGQGALYRVVIGKKDFAIKWYHKGVLHDPNRFLQEPY